MKLILLENVKNLGFKGEVVEVSEGYARNFLFPQHLAVEASDTALRQVKEREQAAEKKEKKEVKVERKIASELDGEEVTIQAKSEKGTLFAAVGPKDVAKALKAKGFKVDVKWITFEPKKEAGTYEALVQFPAGFESTVSVLIETE